MYRLKFYEKPLVAIFFVSYLIGDWSMFHSRLFLHHNEKRSINNYWVTTDAA